MVARINTLAFQGMNAVKVDVQVHLSPGKMVFNTVGLPDKAFAGIESRQEDRMALIDKIMRIWRLPQDILLQPWYGAA